MSSTACSSCDQEAVISAENDGYESLLEGERVKKVENFGAYNTYFGLQHIGNNYYHPRTCVSCLTSRQPFQTCPLR